MAVTLNGTSGLVFNDGSAQDTAATGFGFKNRLINSAMVIDQRRAGAALSSNAAGSQYTLDRWEAYGEASGKFSAQQNAGSVTPPSGFTNYLGVTSLGANTPATGDSYFLRQWIEGFNSADLVFGAAGASTVTLSFWVRSSLTGTFSGVLTNYSQNRAYPYTYTVASANTWEQKSITIVGDTSGTWLATNSGGIGVMFNLGSGATRLGTANAWATVSFVYGATGSTNVLGTSGATFYITGVQLEKGSTATSFDYRPYGTELALCQRYYYKVVTESAASKQLAPNGFVDSTTTAFCWTQFPVEMRISATALEQTGTAANYQVRYTGGSSANCSSVPTFNTGDTWGARSVFTTAAVLTSGQAVGLQTSATAGIYLAWSAEL
jgi:hypothetical protein